MIVDINGERPECIESEDWETIKQMVSKFRSKEKFSEESDICISCLFNPPSSCDGKPCAQCGHDNLCYQRNEDIKIPITNADKIRSMTDEELAHTLLHLDGYNTFCTNFKECVEKTEQGEDIPESQCEACMLRWLREEYPTTPRHEWQLRMRAPLEVMRMSDLGVKICGCIHAVPTNHSKSVTQWFECRNRACRNEGRPADPVTCELCSMRDSGEDGNE